MLRVWGRRDSSNVQKVVWCCDEMGVPFERIDIGGAFGKNREKPYLDLNPNGQVPTIEDEGFVLWESNSILRYLNEKHGEGKLLPATIEGRANANRWMDWQLAAMNPFMVTIFQGLVRKSESDRDLSAIEMARQSAAEKWKIVDEYLEHSTYLGGDTFSMGDIPLGVWAYRWFNLSIERPPLPRVEQWYQRLCERPAYKKNIMIPLT
ncbi:MAG: glutathione S-transferase [Deltaproteobacteria bacterium]|nr:glutathione S-transferase [Deltaproteobacteria bacterium]